MKKRPALKVGDVVRLSKFGIAHNKYVSWIKPDMTMMVKTVEGAIIKGVRLTDLSDGFCKVRCTVITKNQRMGRNLGKKIGANVTFTRRELWRTGYNINDQVPVIPLKDGWLLPADDLLANFKPLVSSKIPLCICDFQVIMSTGCQCGGK